MSYCPECGSEVATNDPFCAYCGIALGVMEEIPVAENPNLDNLPRMGEPEKVQTSAILNKLPAKSDEDNDTDTKEKIEYELPTPVTFDKESNLDGVESSVIEVDDQAMPSSEFESFPEAVVVDTPKEESPVEIELINDNETIEAPQELPETPVAESDEETDAAGEFVSSGISEIDDLADETDDSEVPPVIENVDEFSQTIPYTPADYTKQELLAPEANIIEPEASKVDDDLELRSKLDEINLSLPSLESADTPFLPEDSGEDSVPGSSELRQNDPENNVGIVDAEDEPTTGEEPDSVSSAPQEEAAVKEDIQDLDVAVSIQKEPDLSSVHARIVPAIPSVVPLVESPILNEAMDSPIVEEQIKSEASGQKLDVPELDIEPGENVEEKEARAFTNPNIGYGDTDGRNKQKLKPLDEGTVLNARYEVIRKIGGGGMGAVYLANDKNLGGVLRAVKEMVQSYIEEEAQEKAVNDFKRESLLLTSLEHPGIPTIYDYFFDEKEGRFYLVMKYISGGDLSARLRAAPEGRIDEISVTDWAIQIADVLDYLHNRQPPIVYRDLKPSNIMIDGNTGKVMIIDFGIARWVNKEEKGVTAVGTMGYAPPELFSGNVEPRSDIYSLGSTMFHLMTGADPQSNPLLIFDFNKNPRPRQINPNLSDQMEQILMKSVEYNSEQRFSSAAEMRDELQKHLERLKKGTVTFGVISNVVTGQSLSSVPVFCGFCGQKIVASDVFCPFCGAQQPQVGQSQQLKSGQIQAGTNVTAKLSIVGTNELEQNEYSLEKDNNLLGRRDPMSNIFPEVDMSKYDPQTKISRKHARIWREGNVFMLEDLGSSNGTIVINHNNDPVRLLPRQPHVLSNGDKLKLGDTTLRFTIG